MEYKVIGWTHYDDGGFPPVAAEELFALRPVIVKALREGGYRCGGDAHNYRDGCPPVLNSGETDCISSFRSWGGIMAEAWEISDMDGYEYMAFYVDSLVEDSVYPEPSVDFDSITDKARLSLPEIPSQGGKGGIAPPIPFDFDSYVAFSKEYGKTLTLAEGFAAEEPTTHELRLDGVYFGMIKEGAKTVELRLLDEKRRLIRPKDIIVFTNREDERQKLRTRVEKMHIAGGFDELLFDPDMLRKSGLSHLGSLGAEELMERFYPTDRQEHFGVVGIEVEPILND